MDHSTAGAQLVWEQLTKQGDVGSIVGQILSLCIASHHSGLIDCLSSDKNGPIADNFSRRINKPDSKTHIQEVMTKVDPPVSKRCHELLGGSWLIDGLKESMRKIMLRDNKPREDPSKNQIIQFKLGLLVRLLFSCLIDADRTNTADFESPKTARNRPNGQYVDWTTLTGRLEQRLGSVDIHFIQSIVAAR